MRLLTQIDLASYIEYTSRGTWQPAKHLTLLCDALHDVEAGRCTRLLIEMPPRRGKSKVVSKSFPAWYLGHHPDNEVVLACYGADLATDFSRDNRDLMREYGSSIFGVSLSDDSSSVNRWGIKGHRGGLVAVGVGGPLTGRGAHIAIIDDPVKSAAEANSKTYRDRTYEWYQTVLRTRLAPGGAIILVQTRWHKQDLAGMLLEAAANGGEQWRVIRLPELAEPGDLLGRAPGEPLWPERFDLQSSLTTRTSMTPYQWASMYQQSPIGVENALWQYDMIESARWPAGKPIPPLVRIVVGVDPAAEDKVDSDETGIVTVGIDDDGELYVLDDSSQIAEALIWAGVSVSVFKERDADYIVGETNQGGTMVKAVIHNVDPKVPFKPVRATAGRGKRVRATPVSVLYAQGRVHHVGKFPELEEQMCTWSPRSTDSPDRIDALVWACTELMTPAPAYQPPIVL